MAGRAYAPGFPDNREQGGVSSSAGATAPRMLGDRRQQRLDIPSLSSASLVFMPPRRLDAQGEVR
jgi:hypothetical protein